MPSMNSIKLGRGYRRYFFFPFLARSIPTVVPPDSITEVCNHIECQILRIALSIFVADLLVEPAHLQVAVAMKLKIASFRLSMLKSVKATQYGGALIDESG